MRPPSAVAVRVLVAVIISSLLGSSISTPTDSSSFLQRGLDACNEQINFCTLGNKSENHRSCCSQCSCWDSCYEKAGCCPDIANANFRFKHSCQSVYYKNSQFVKKQNEVPERSYEMVSKCPDGQECKVNHTETEDSVSFDDIVAVYNEQYKVIFQNKKCAICNDITNFTRWRLIASDCILNENKTAEMSSEELLKYMLDNCIIFSLPHTNIITEVTPQRCDVDEDSVIDACNVTGKWGVYDQYVENACLDKNFKSPTRQQRSKTAYKNVYCFICNNPQYAKLSRMCYFNTWDKFLTEFPELMDLQTDFSPAPDRISNHVTCNDNEIVDEFFNTCRPVICPWLKLFSNGLCKNFPFEIQHVINYKLSLILVPSTKVPIDVTTQDWDVDQLFEDILDISNVRHVCTRFQLDSITLYWDRDTIVLHSFFLEILVLPNFINCTYENLAKMLDGLTKDKAVNISVSYSSNRTERINLLLAPDKRTQMFDSLERLEPNNQSYFSKTLFKTNHRGKLSIVNVEFTDVCPHVKLNESEFCRLVSKNQQLSCTSKETFHPEYKIFIHTFVHTYADYLNDRFVRYYFLCLRDFKLLTAELIPKRNTVMGFLSLILSCVSMACITMILLLLCLMKKITNAPMVIFGSALVNLFIAHGVFQFGSGWTDNYLACQVVGIAVHYFWLSTVFALNAYCVLILRKMLSVGSRMCSIDLLLSLIYVYGLPVLFIVANIIYTNADTTQFTSGYGAGQCHINTPVMRGLLFALPILLTVVFNCVVNGMAAYRINRIQLPVSNLRRESRYAAVYFRLLLVTGLTWIFGILKEFVDSVILDYCFSLFVGGQGVMLLISFVCRKHFCQDILYECRSRKSSRFVTQTSMSLGMSE